MRHPGKIAQVCFTYVGTVVGAGFATGQEILQFFTRYGWWAVVTIALASLLFVWLGTKLMILAHDMKAATYEDLNSLLFGKKIGFWISTFTLFILFGVTSVMLAGGGTVFFEQLHLSYQSGLVITLCLAYWVLSRGMRAIVAVNLVVVPLMICFSLASVWSTMHFPGESNWLHLNSDYSAARIWFSPFLYTAFNLMTAQAVLVPLASTVKSKSVLYWGGLLGGICIGLMLLAGHYALSARMPGIVQYEIPMAHIVVDLGRLVQILFILVIYGEIFTTFIANAYGLALQIGQRSGIGLPFLIPVILLLSYIFSLIGFKTLLSSLYPFFGFLSLIWLTLMIWRKGPSRS